MENSNRYRWNAGPCAAGRENWGQSSRPLYFLVLALAWFAGGCEEENLRVPGASAVEEAYTYSGNLQASMNGNVAEITVVQPTDQIQRGGTLWAKVGPYVVLFSQETQELFERYPGLAGVRVITTTPNGTEIARALLPRDALNNLTWQRARNIAGLARRDGTRRPRLLEDLVRWGEEHTEYTYNPSYS